MWFRRSILTSAVAGFVFAALPAMAAVTHTTSNLNLHGGPGTHHEIRAVIPAGAAIDIGSCGHTWCYMTWAGHVGVRRPSVSDSSCDGTSAAPGSSGSCP